MADRDFIPALGFDRLTPVFDPIAHVFVRDRALKRSVVANAGLRPGESVLDVGCGTGTLAIAAAAAARDLRVTGLDADPTILRRARQRAEEASVALRFDEGFSTDLPYEDGSFDVVLSTLFFHHLQVADKRTTAAEVSRVLRTGGRLVIGDLGRPHGPLMRLATLATVQLVDGFETTSPQLRGGLGEVLAEAGFADVTVRERFRSATGTWEVLTATT